MTRYVCDRLGVTRGGCDRANVTGGCDTGRVNVSGVRRASPVTLPVAHSKRVGTRSVAKLRVTVCHKWRQSPDLPPSLPKAGDSALLRAPREDMLPGREAEDSHHRTKPRWQNCSDAQPSLQRSRALQAVRWDHPGGWGGEGGGGFRMGTHAHLWLIHVSVRQNH